MKSQKIGLTRIKIDVRNKTLKPMQKPIPALYGLFIGINYIGTNNELHGCINDVTNTRDMLVKHFNYKQDNTVLLTDDTKIKPTKTNIINQLNLIIKKVNTTGGELFVHYSGHGSYITDKSNDEKDGHDEVIVPLDFNKSGFIIDDDIKTILTTLNKSIKCMLLFDSCFSGSVADLPFSYSNEIYKENNSDNINANIIMLSGCKDNQYSMDIVKNNKYVGAMTSSLLNILDKNNYNINLTDLCISLRAELTLYAQYPILSSSKPIVLTNMFCKNGILLP